MGTEITFVRNWSRTYRGLELDPAPIHERHSATSSTAAEKPDVFEDEVYGPGEAAGEQFVPGFMSAMPKIAGPQVCVVPFPQSKLQALKASASTGLAAGQFISTDDALTAHAWRAMAAVRCSQLGLTTDCEDVSTCIRAC